MCTPGNGGILESMTEQGVLSDLQRISIMNNIKTVTEYNLIPGTAAYLGSEFADGSMDEFVADNVADALNPICFKDPEGVRHYFDLVG
mgnify:CR=1 FL=1